MRKYEGTDRCLRKKGGRDWQRHEREKNKKFIKLITHLSVRFHIWEHTVHVCQIFWDLEHLMRDVLLVFGVPNDKYLAFGTPDDNALRTKMPKKFILILFTFSLSSQRISLSLSLSLSLSHTHTQQRWSHHTDHHAMSPSFVPSTTPRHITELAMPSTTPRHATVPLEPPSIESLSIGL